jgi:hypothetical protein
MKFSQGKENCRSDVRYALACRFYRIHSMLSLSALDDKLIKRIGHPTCNFPHPECRD